MKQKLFATRHTAGKLMEEAIAIWQQGNFSEHLEGIDNDPVFSLFMTALAYQSNEFDNQIEYLKSQVLEEFARMHIPYELSHATPSAVVVQSFLHGDVPYVMLDADKEFSLAEKYTFVPLLKTRVVNMFVKSVIRLDGRRWKVSLGFKSPVSDLDGICFSVTNTAFKDLKVTCNGRNVALHKPWDIAELPLCDCFSIDGDLYNKQLVYNGSATWFDLFAQCNQRLFVVDSIQYEPLLTHPTDSVDLIFEFNGINDNFVLNKESLLFNCIFLVNAKKQNVELSAAMPIVKLVGGDGADSQNNEQLMHVLRPAAEQMYQGGEVVVRKVGAERFNYNSLLRLTHYLIDKYSSDYYAFKDVDGLKDASGVQQIHTLLKNIAESIENVHESSVKGVYLLLDNMIREGYQNNSFNVNYLTTNASAPNSLLLAKEPFKSPVGLDMEMTKIVSEPILGTDESYSEDAMNSISKYFMITGDKLVTVADIKMFCYNYLLVKHDISQSMIDRIVVRSRIQQDRAHCGREIMVEITILDDVYVKRMLMDKLPQTELVMQKMIEVRSANVYPVNVSIKFK